MAAWANTSRDEDDRDPVREFVTDSGLLATATALISGEINRGESVTAEEALRVLDQFCAR